MGRARRSKRAGNAADERVVRAIRCDDDAYHRWRTIEVEARGRTLIVASRAGVPGHGELDPAEALLLDHIEVGATESVCQLQCGAGVIGVFAALATTGRVSLADVNVAAIEAARRTLAANGANGDVTFGRGDAVGAPAAFDAVAIRLPKGRVPTARILWDAFHLLRPGGRCYLAGANDEGIRTAIRQMDQLFGSASVLGYRSGHRVAMSIRPDSAAPRAGDFDTVWMDAGHFHRYWADTPAGMIAVCSRPGIFSWEGLDAGSAALLDVMDAHDAHHILDLGCGAGIIGATAARLAARARVTLVDADFDAVRSSERTIAENDLSERCEVLASDVGAVIPDRSIDVVLTNPPFHTGKATNLDVAAQFVRDAARVLRPGGRLYLVANRTLPYEQWVQTCFGACSTVLDGREFKVLSATAPGH